MRAPPFSTLRYAPLATCVAGVATLVATVAAAFSQPHYFEITLWPFISQMGREPDAPFTIFAVGMVLTSLLCGASGVAYYLWLGAAQAAVRSAVPTWKSKTCAARAFLGAMLVGAPSLAVMALSNHRINYYRNIGLHVLSTILFFSSCLVAFGLIYWILVGVVRELRRASGSSPEALALLDKYRPLLASKRRAMVGLAVVFFAHVPVAYVVRGAVCPRSGRLSLDECLQVVPGSARDVAAFCHAWSSDQGINSPFVANMTRLRKRDQCTGLSTYCAVSQHALVLALLYLVLTWYWDIGSGPAQSLGRGYAPAKKPGAETAQSNEIRCSELARPSS